MARHLKQEPTINHTPKTLVNLLEKAETQFVERDFQNSLSNAQIVLKQLTNSAPQPFLFSPYHNCVEGCLCSATVILIIEAYYELQRHDKIRGFLEMHYRRVCDCPYEVFIIWAQYCVSEKRFEVAQEDIVAVLKKDEPPISEERYAELVELLVFHCLHPLREHKKAFLFLEKCSLPPEKKQAFTTQLKRLKNKKAKHERTKDSTPQITPSAESTRRSLAASGFPHRAEAEVKSDFQSTPRSLQNKPKSSKSWWRRWMDVLVEAHGIKKITAVLFIFFFLLYFNEHVRTYVVNTIPYQVARDHLKQFYVLAFSYSMGRFAQPE